MSHEPDARKSVPAPQPTLLQRLREIVTSPNAIRTASVAAFFVIWEYYGRRMDPIFMAPPSAIFEAALQLIQRRAEEGADPDPVAVLGRDGAHRGGRHRARDRDGAVAHPGIHAGSFINALYAIPRIALVPLIILWAGLEFVGKVTILVSVAIFPITVNTFRASATCAVRCWRSAVPMARPNGRFSGRSFCRRRFPSSWRASGSRSAWRSSASSSPSSSPPSADLGGMIVEYANVFATAKLFVPIIVIAIVGVVLTELVMWLERRMSRWRQLERERF